MTWVNLSSAFGYGTKLTSSNMQQLRDNIAAAFAKDTGAPELATDYVITTMLKTSVGTQSGTLGGVNWATVTMHDYCFSPNIYGEDYIVVRGQQATNSNTVGRFELRNTHGTTSYDYDVDWRYVTASDEPFIFALINKITGQIEHVWMCDDPPPGYWGLDKRPDVFELPVIPDNVDDYEQVTLFKQEQAFLDELRAKKAKDKKPMIEIFNGYELDKKSQLFKSKNISMI